MRPSEQIEAYCRTVSEQIRWKKVRPQVAAEIESHLCDQRDAYLSDGDGEEDATRKAVAQMGDPVLVGQALDQAHRPRPQWFMIGLTGIFMLLGLAVNCFLFRPAPGLMVLPYFLPYAAAFVVFLCFYMMDFSLLGRHAWTLYGLVLAASVLGLLLGERDMGRLVWGVWRGVSFRLSYLSLIFPVAFALVVYRMRNTGLRGIFLCAAACLPPTVILIEIPCLSGLVLYAAAALGALCLAAGRGWFGVSRRRGLGAVLLLVSAGLLCLAVAGRRYIPGRVSFLLHPEQDRLGAGYVHCMIRDILSEAVFWGSGAVPQGMKSIEMLPSLQTDFFLVYLIHRIGFAAWLGIAALMAVFFAVGVRKALREKSVLGSLLALTAVLTFGVQAGAYLFSNLGYGLFGTLSLPFISYGRSALLINSALTGLMLSVFRTGEAVQDLPALPLEGRRDLV